MIWNENLFTSRRRILDDRSGRGAIPHWISGAVNIIILLYFTSSCTIQRQRRRRRRQKDETVARRIMRNDYYTSIHVLYIHICIFRYSSRHVTYADPYIIIICFNPVGASCRSSEWQPRRKPATRPLNVAQRDGRTWTPRRYYYYFRLICGFRRRRLSKCVRHILC